MELGKFTENSLLTGLAKTASYWFPASSIAVLPAQRGDETPSTSMVSYRSPRSLLKVAVPEVALEETETVTTVVEEEEVVGTLVLDEEEVETVVVRFIGVMNAGD